MALDYGTISSDLAALLTATDFSSVFAGTNPPITKVRVMEEAQGVEMGLNQMPFVNVRLMTSEVELVNIPDGYYEHVMFEVDIYGFDFTSYRSATTLRDGILKICLDAVRAAHGFSASISTCRVGPQIRFAALSPDNGAGHVAMATFTVDAEGYT